MQHKISSLGIRLEYLHRDCKPPIVHRDIKSANIILSENFESKLADFGLSRTFPTECGTYVSTVVAGTPGYLDPEVHVTDRYRLNEKRDIYSFAVVLLQIITRQPVIRKKENENSHITQWVTNVLAKDDIKNIIDPSLEGDFDIISAKMAVELAVTFASQTSAKRPTMNEVVTELKECLAMELARKRMVVVLISLSIQMIYNDGEFVY
ncbi:hypothetical protein Dsin_014037 [Dipteronia sinensis]|uniref:Protein kinase domain-containing protein n=1 Tax=Dipteronia sinensis TaxID=43782 RepID=A0AAE0ALG8_9ROSI|nr:hypothetical protein Dsin_014037 [Dipteronia sinensis]